MFTEELCLLADQGEKLDPEACEMPFRKDHEALKAIMDNGYKKAQRAICRSLMAICQEKFHSQN